MFEKTDIITTLSGEELRKVTRKWQNKLPSSDQIVHLTEECFYKENTQILHNPDGPARVTTTIDQSTQKQVSKYIDYRIKGQRHRSNDLPATINITGDVKEEYWFIDGVSKRIDPKLPAVIKTKLDEQGNDSYVTEFWRLKNGLQEVIDDMPSMVNMTEGLFSWMSNHNQHREDDKPAIIRYSRMHDTMSYTYFKENHLNRDNDKPAYVQWFWSHADSEWKTEVEEWYVNGMKHRENGPAAMRYFSDGTVSTVVCYNENRIHSIDGKPSIVNYSPSGAVLNKSYHNYGEQQSFDGKPAFVTYTESGQPLYQAWYDKGKKHRSDGPSELFTREDGTVTTQSFHKRGTELPTEHFELLDDPELFSFEFEIYEV